MVAFIFKDSSKDHITGGIFPQFSSNAFITDIEMFKRIIKKININYFRFS